MRKKYIKPEMKVYEIGTPQLLAASGAGAPEVDFYPDEGPEDENEDMWQSSAWVVVLTAQQDITICRLMEYSDIP